MNCCLIFTILVTFLYFVSQVQVDCFQGSPQIHSANSLPPIEVEGQFDTPYQRNVSSSTGYLFWFSANITGNINDITINVNSKVGSNATIDNPIRFELHWQELIEQPSSWWFLPNNDTKGTLYYESNQTIGSDINGRDTRTAYVRVIVSTLSIIPVEFEVSVSFIQSNFISKFDELRSLDVTLFSSKYFKIKIDDRETSQTPEYVVMEVTSDNDLCATVGLLRPRNPIIIKERNVEQERHLTMTTTATVTFHRKYLEDGRFLVFILHPDDLICTKKSNSHILPSDPFRPESLLIRQKSFNITIREKITNNQYLTSILATTGFFIGLALCFAIIYCVVVPKNQIQSSREEAEVLIPHHEQNERPLENAENSGEISYFCGFFSVAKNVNACVLDGIPQAQKCSRRYWKTLLVIAAFYILPSIQMAWIYERVFQNTGDEDICYFNYKCLHSLHSIAAFNHIFSNIGYIILGLLFTLLVSWDLRKVKCSTKGTYQAMGIALVIQGVMSAIYHSCPNKLNFQFDTCFMYITATLCCVAIYQAQYSHATTSASLVYLVVAILASLSVAAVIFEIGYFWEFITIIHQLICFAVSLHLFSVGENFIWKLEFPCRQGRSYQEIFCSVLRPFKINSRKKFLLATMFLLYNGLNLAAAFVGHQILKESQDFASFQLVLFIFNLIVFSVFHAWFVLKQTERKHIFLIVFIFILCGALWSGAFWFYLQSVSSWGVSPALSRERNRDCILLDFYDHHDIWHFLSSIGMFSIYVLFYYLDHQKRRIEYRIQEEIEQPNAQHYSGNDG